MSHFRQINPAFWSNPQVFGKMSPDERLLMLYLFSNPHSNLCGCYEISLSTMSRETGFTMEKIENLIESLSKTHRVISYSLETKEILVEPMLWNTWTSSPKIQKCILREVKKVKWLPFRICVRETRIRMLELRRSKRNKHRDTLLRPENFRI